MLYLYTLSKIFGWTKIHFQRWQTLLRRLFWRTILKAMYCLFQANHRYNIYSNNILILNTGRLRYPKPGFWLPAVSWGKWVEQGFSSFFPYLMTLRKFEKSSNIIVKIWQKTKKSLSSTCLQSIFRRIPGTYPKIGFGEPVSPLIFNCYVDYDLVIILPW